MKRRRLKVELTLLGPILTQSSVAGEPGIDAPVARDAFGRVMLPYSLVKGKILDAFRDLRPNDPTIMNWIGVPSDEGAYEPERGRLSFTDFTTKTAERKQDDHDGIIERIQIDANTGSVAGRMLAMLEAPYGYNEPVLFEGFVGFIADDAEATIIQQELKQAFDWVSSYGAMRTVGFGRKQSVELKSQPATTKAVTKPAEKAVLPLRFHLDRPLCIVGRKHSGNHFESLEHIPGSVLKGAAARLILDLNSSKSKFIDSKNPEKRFGLICKHFESIRFGEAKLMGKGEGQRRPVVPPLSLVVTPTDKVSFFDVALLEAPQLINGASPAFQPDWKEEDCINVSKAFGTVKASKERRIRTAIDPEKWQALDRSLFSFDLVLPETPEHKCVWEGTIGLNEIPSQEHLLLRNELLELLSGGLTNIGKTRAIAEVEWLPNRTAPSMNSNISLPDDLHIITLQTDFLMTNPETLQKRDLQKAYEEFWQDVSGKKLDLVRFFAKQSLHGGFIAQRANQQQYKPFLLTERGSVFVLRSYDPKEAQKLLDSWTETGLPMAPWVSVYYGSPNKPLWMTCPLLPHVGFGEIVVDLECHKTKRPQQ